MVSAQLCIIMKTATIFMFCTKENGEQGQHILHSTYRPENKWQKCEGLDFNTFYLRIETIIIVGAKGTIQPGLRLVPLGNFFLALNRSHHFLLKKVRI